MQQRSIRSLTPPTRSPLPLLIATLIAFLGILTAGFYLFTAKTVDLSLDEQHITLRTHQVTVKDALLEAGVYLETEDQVQPALETPIHSGLTITVKKARPILILADGRQLRVLTQQSDPARILQDAGITLGKHDALSSDGFSIRIQRAKSFVLDDAGVAQTLFSTGDTVSAALSDAAVILYTADQIQPSINSALSDNLRITIQRSVPITIQVDGRTLNTRTRAKTVGEALDTAGVALVGLDRSVPALDQPVSSGTTIRVIRVTEAEEIERTSLPFKRTLTPDASLDLDQVVILQAGIEGVQEVHTRVRREDGVEISRSAPLRWITRPTQDEVGQIGTKVVLKALDTPLGAFQYWRILTVRATAYKPALSGKDASDPLYGVTSTGQRLSKGIVAVDPALIPLGTTLYIPDYGVAVAGDTAPNLKGLTIRLGYDDTDYRAFKGSLTVYLLAPAPSADKIAPLPTPETP